MRILLHGVADLGDKFVGILCFVGTYMVDVEHCSVCFVSVFLYPRDDGGVDIGHLLIAAFDDTACDFYRQFFYSAVTTISDAPCVPVGYI